MKDETNINAIHLESMNLSKLDLKIRAKKEIVGQKNYSLIEAKKELQQLEIDRINIINKISRLAQEGHWWKENQKDK